jgi:Xaa-Pro aminopeptidase
MLDTRENIRLTPNLAAEAAKIITSLNLQNTKIGMDSFRWWPVGDYRTFMDICPKAELVEAHRLFGEVRGPKSDEELAIMQKAIRISDMAHFAFLANLRSGQTEIEASRYAEDVLNSHGVGDRIVLIHTRPEATYLGFPNNTVIQKPNPVTYSPEFTRSKGYGAQMIREYWWEKPKGTYEKMFQLWADMREMIVKEFRPAWRYSMRGKRWKTLLTATGSNVTSWAMPWASPTENRPT